MEATEQPQTHIAVTVIDASAVTEPSPEPPASVPEPTIPKVIKDPLGPKGAANDNP